MENYYLLFRDAGGGLLELTMRLRKFPNDGFNEVKVITTHQH